MSAPSALITASMLYDIATCEHRLWMDQFTDPAGHDEASPFVELLWRRGRAHEEQAIAGSKVDVLNLRTAPAGDRRRLSLEAMENREPLIYGAQIVSNDLFGEPDLLRLTSNGYVPGDIKSGAADEGPTEDRKPKKKYAVQLALYVDILERMGMSSIRAGFIWDVLGKEVTYDLVAPKGPKNPQTLWDDYTEALIIVREIVAGERVPGPAYTSDCKHCWWYRKCIEELRSKNDLTLLAGLGRSKREAFLPHVSNISELAERPPESFLDPKGKSILKGIGIESINRFQSRARLISAGGPAHLTGNPIFPESATELFFDIETDPMRNQCYLHGFLERRNGDVKTESFVSFFNLSATPEAERSAFMQAWQYVCTKRPCVLYIYSKYERTWWRTLQQRYPDVCSAEAIEELFAPDMTVDLLEVVEGFTEWPTMDHSIKSLAGYLGFKWRDSHPSGAASIEWYDRHVSGDAAAKARILEYNEDDCRATRVLLDGIRALARETGLKVQ